MFRPLLCLLLATPFTHAKVIVTDVPLGGGESERVFFKALLNKT